MLDRLRSEPWPALAVGVVVCVGVGLATAYGAGLGEALLYGAYELGFVVLPGWLAYRALSSRPGGTLKQLAFGWALGYALEILAFMLTAATGTRGLLVVYPLLVIAGSGLVLLRRRRADSAEPPSERLSARLRWLVAGVCVVAIAYIALTLFPATPLPGGESVRYFQDYPWAISIAAEAKEHWPIQDPSVSGEPFPYHFFAHLHMAAASQITGIDLPVIFFRLWLLPLIVLLVLQLVAAGRALLGSAAVGLIAACLVLLVGQLQLEPADSLSAPVAFLGLLFTYLTISPSFVFGLVLFIPLITLIGERLAAEGRLGRPGDWALIALLAVGASDAKIVLLPLIAGGLVLFCAWSWLGRRRIPGAAGPALALTVLVFAALYVLQYRGHSSGLSLDLLSGYDFVINMPAVLLVRDELLSIAPDLPGMTGFISAGGVVFGVLGLLGAQLLGMVLLLRQQRFRLDASQAWLLALFVAGLGALAALDSPAGNQQYFFFTSMVAGCLVSAQGLWRAWESRPAAAEAPSRLLAVGLGWCLVLIVLIAAPDAVGLFAGAGDEAARYMLRFAGLAISLVLLYWAARRWARAAAWASGALVCAAILLVGALDVPLQKVRPALSYEPPAASRTLTPELYDALTWLRDESSPDDVIAVNKQEIETGPYEFNYGAFAERRVFLAGWAYSGEYADRDPEGALGGGNTNPFPERLALNKAAFEHPNRASLDLLHDQFGVRYLVVDELSGYPADVEALSELTTPVYEAPGVSIFELS